MLVCDNCSNPCIYKELTTIMNNSSLKAINTMLDYTPLTMTFGDCDNNDKGVKDMLICDNCVKRDVCKYHSLAEKMQNGSIKQMNEIINYSPLYIVLYCNFLTIGE